jgi:DNA-binding ferritin-like protein (Dps family)
MSGIGLRNSATQMQLTAQREQQGMSAMVAQVLQNHPTEQAGREALLQMARDQGVSGTVVLAGVTELSGLYGAATGLTKEDQDELSKRQTTSQASLERFNQDEKTALDKVIKNAPVEPVFSFSDKDRMTEGQVYEQIAKVIPKNREETVKTIQEKVSDLSGKYKVPSGMELGPVIQEAFKRTGTTGEDGAWFSLDSDVDSSVFEKNFNEVLGSAIKSFNNQTIVDNAQAEYTRKVREKEDDEIRNLSQYKNSRTDTYKFRKDIQQR